MNILIKIMTCFCHKKIKRQHFKDININFDLVASIDCYTILASVGLESYLFMYGKKLPEYVLNLINTWKMYEQFSNLLALMTTTRWFQRYAKLSYSFRLSSKIEQEIVMQSKSFLGEKIMPPWFWDQNWELKISWCNHYYLQHLTS